MRPLPRRSVSTVHERGETAHWCSRSDDGCDESRGTRRYRLACGHWSLSHIHCQLHFRMDAAEHQIGSGFREGDLDSLARLLRAGVEIELVIEHADIVRAGVVVEEPQPLAAADAHM